MIFGVFIALALLAVAYFHWIQGLFSATISAVLAVIAAVVAVAFQESLVEGPLANVAPNWMPSLVLLLLFALVYIILRTIFDKAVPGGVQLPAMFDKVGGAIMGLVAGAFALGVVVIAAQHLPFSPSIGGYVRYETSGERSAPVPTGKVGSRPKEGNTYDEVTGETFEKATAKSLLVPVDDIVVGAVSHLSDNGSLAGSKKFADIHPDYLQELFGNRLGLERAATHTAFNTAKVQMIDVAGAYLAPPFDETNSIDSEFKRTRGTALRVQKPPPGEIRVVVRVKFDASAAETKDKKIHLTPGAVRLVTMRPQGVRDEPAPYNNYPIGTLEVTGIFYLNKIDDAIFISAPAKKVDGSGDAPAEVDFVFQIKEKGALVGGGKGASTMQFAPGSFLEVKKYGRVELTGAAGEVKATMKPLPVVAVKHKHLEWEQGPPPPEPGKKLAAQVGAGGPPTTGPAPAPDATAQNPTPAPTPAPAPTPQPNAPAPDAAMSRLVGTWESAEKLAYTYRSDGTYAGSKGGVQSAEGTWKITGTEQDGTIVSVEMFNTKTNKTSNVKWNATDAAGNPPQIIRVQPASPSPFVRKG
jgi:hypothetical protein